MSIRTRWGVMPRRVAVSIVVRSFAILASLGVVHLYAGERVFVIDALLLFMAGFEKLNGLAFTARLEICTKKRRLSE